MKRFQARGIVYETDGCKVNLPETLTVDCEDEEGVADAISEATGWLVASIGEIIEL